jgi:hypothetical protein
MTRGSGGIVPLFLTSIIDGGEWSASRRGRFTYGERASGTHWIGGWVDPRAGLDSVKRTLSRPRRESNPIRPSRRCADCVIPAPVVETNLPHPVCLCVLYNSHSKKHLLEQTALTGWSL